MIDEATLERASAAGISKIRSLLALSIIAKRECVSLYRVAQCLDITVEDAAGIASFLEDKRMITRAIKELKP